MWLDANNNANRTKAVKILSQPEYVGADDKVIANCMTGTFEYEKGDKRAVPDFNVFFRYFATYPYYCDAIWYLTQMRRWGQIAEGQARRLVRRDRQEGLPAGHLSRRRRSCWSTRARRRRTTSRGTPTATSAPTADFIDGIDFDGRKPNAYIDKLDDRPEGRPARRRRQGGRQLSDAGPTRSTGRIATQHAQKDCRMSLQRFVRPASGRRAARRERWHTRINRSPAFSNWSGSAGSCR